MIDDFYDYGTSNTCDRCSMLDFNTKRLPMGMQGDLWVCDRCIEECLELLAPLVGARVMAWDGYCYE